jgi:hypothetical protein
MIRNTARIRRALKLIVIVLDAQRAAGEPWLYDSEGVTDQDLDDAIKWIDKHADGNPRQRAGGGDERIR